MSKVERARIYPHGTAGSVGSSVTLGVYHQFPVRPDEVVELWAIDYDAECIVIGTNVIYVAWALSFDKTHDSLTTDLNTLITDDGIHLNDRVFARARLNTDMDTGNAAFAYTMPIHIPLYGYEVGRSLIALFFNESGGSKDMAMELTWTPRRVGVAYANQMNLRRSVERGGA